MKTRRLLNKGKRDSGGLIPLPAGGLHIHTSKPLHDRALRIMQALLIGFEKRGFSVSTTTDGVRVTILDARAWALVSKRARPSPQARSRLGGNRVEASGALR